MKHLVILSYGRSGTNAVFDHLMNNPHIIVPNKNKEPLNTDSNGGSYSKINNISVERMRNQKNIKLEDSNYHWYDDHLMKMMKRAENKNKILLSHIKPGHLEDLNISIEEAVETLKDKFNFIIIIRKNYLKMIASGLFKKARKVAGKDKVKMNKWHVGTACKWYDKINQRIIDSTLPYARFMIDYEEDLHDNTRITTDKLSKYFDFYEPYEYEQQRFNFHTQKNQWSDIPLKDKIENWEEIVEALSGTKHEWMLYG